MSRMNIQSPFATNEIPEKVITSFNTYYAMDNETDYLDITVERQLISYAVMDTDPDVNAEFKSTSKTDRT